MNYGYEILEGDIKLRVAGTISNSVVNGVGIRDVIFLQGCSHHCKGCHNPETWSFDDGTEIGITALYKQFLNSDNNLTISGGEPLLQLDELYQLLYLFYLNTNKKVWLYTGYEFEDIPIEIWSKLNKLGVEVVVDGKFEIDKKDLTLQFRGSSNQRLIDLNETLKIGSIVFWED